MKKIIEFIRKHDNIFMFIILFLITSSYVFCIKLEANDQLWNFSNIYKMTNGYTIYKDLNVIITPLYFFIGKIAFSLFESNYLVYSIYQNFIIYLLLFFSIYQLMKKMKIRKINSALYTMIISVIMITIMPEASYNILAILFSIIGIIHLLSSKNRYIDNMIQGVIYFLIFMTKQNTGVLYILGSILAQILIQKDKKISIKNISQQLIACWIMILGYLVYLKYNNNLYNFINYCFLGIKEFSQENLVVKPKNVIFILMASIVSIVSIIATYKKRIPLEQIQRKNIKILGSISCFMLAISYPLLNDAHTLIASVTFMILFSYMLDIMILRELLNGKKVEIAKKVIILILGIIFVIINLCNNLTYFIEIMDEDYYFSNDSPYYGAIAKKELVKEINEITKYIEKENQNRTDVKIISCYSNLYMNVLNKNNGDMDLPFSGNMGQNGVNGMIAKINNLKNTKILILSNEKDRHYQESKRIFKYIEENFEKEGKIGKFSIYRVK
ncbi:MAG: hypothetical protein GX682_03180 [Clostridiaceae bacterium]|nr:hypothetical protein [Clostridiaceae bacterium]